MARWRPTPPDEAVAEAEVFIGQLRFADAARVLLGALFHAPDHAGVLRQLGICCLSCGQPADAMGYFARAERAAPDDPETAYRIGLALLELKRFDLAEARFRRVLVRDPTHVDARVGLGDARLGDDRAEDVLRELNAAIALDPANRRAHLSLGRALLAADRHDAAIAALRTALSLCPNEPTNGVRGEALSLLGNACADLGRHDEALGFFDTSSLRDPESANILFNRALSELHAGRYDEAWRHYERRWDVAGFSPKPVGHTLPDLKDLAGKTVLVVAEQGMGDCFMLARYIPLLAERGARVVVSAYESLVSIMRTVPGVSAVIGEDEKEPPHDLAISMFSLPLVFGTRIDTVPGGMPYMSVPEANAAAWSGRLGTRSRPRVGVFWATNSGLKRKSMPLRLLRPLLESTAVEWHVLQKEVAAEDFADAVGLRIHGDTLNDFADTAALIEAMDLVIAIDTGAAHLAGALGKETWLMLPFAPDWRWLGPHDRSPWYPDARQFRQARVGDWESVIADVAAALSKRFPE